MTSLQLLTMVPAMSSEKERSYLIRVLKGLLERIKHTVEKFGGPFEEVTDERAERFYEQLLAETKDVQGCINGAATMNDDEIAAMYIQERKISR